MYHRIPETYLASQPRIHAMFSLPEVQYLSG